MGQCSSSASCVSGEPTRSLEALLQTSLHPGCLVFVSYCSGDSGKQAPCSAPYMVKGSTWMSYSAAGFMVPSADSNSSLDVVLASMDNGGSVVRISLSSLVKDERVRKIAVSCSPKFTASEEAAMIEFSTVCIGQKQLARRVMLLGCRGRKTFVAGLVAEMLLHTGRAQKAGNELYGPAKCSLGTSWLSDLTFIRLQQRPSVLLPDDPAMGGPNTGKSKGSLPGSSSDTTSAINLSTSSSNASTQLQAMPGSAGAVSQPHAKDTVHARGSAAERGSSEQLASDPASSTVSPRGTAEHAASVPLPATAAGKQALAAADGQPSAFASSQVQGAAASPRIKQLIREEPPAAAVKGQQPSSSAGSSSLDGIFAMIRRWSTPDPALNGSCPLPATTAAH